MKADDYMKLRADLLQVETFLIAQGLPRLAYQTKIAARILMRPEVEEAVLKDLPGEYTP